MAISYLIFIFMVIFLLKSYHKAFIALILLSTWLNHFVIFGADIFTYLSIVSLALFPFKVKNISGIIKMMPIKIGLLLVFLSYTITFVFTNDNSVVSYFTNVLRDIINVFIFWCVFIKSPQQYIKFIVAIIFSYAIIVGGYTLFETVCGINPYIEFVNTLGLYKEDFLITEIRFGLKRSQSIFSMHTTNGAVLLMLFCVISWLKYKTDVIKNHNKTILCLLIMLFISILTTGARSAILSLVICMFMFYDRVFRKFSNFIIIGVFVVSLFFIFQSFILDVIESFTDTQSVSGSSSDMRQEQLAEVIRFFNKSVLIGNGINYTSTTAINLSNSLYGAESVWFQLLIDRGILGVMTFVIFICQCVCFVWKSNSHKLLFVILGFIVFNTLSSIPHFNIYYLFAYLTIMVEAKRKIPTNQSLNKIYYHAKH